MTEFWNATIAIVAALTLGAIIHSALLHSKERKKFEREYGH